MQNPFTAALNTLPQRKFSLLAFSYSVLDDGVQKILFVVYGGVESSPFFSLYYHPRNQISQHTGTCIYTYAHSIHKGIGEHERDPAWFGFFDTLTVAMPRSRGLNFTYRAGACVRASVLHDLERQEREGDIE